MKLPDRSLDWLRYLDRTASTSASQAPVDLIDSSYAMALMARLTPAWIEPYITVLDGLIDCHAREAIDDERAELLSVLVGVRSSIDSSADHRRDRPKLTFGPTRAWQIIEMQERLAVATGLSRESASSETGWESVALSWSSGLRAMRAAADVVARALPAHAVAGSVEACPQVVDVDVANMTLDRAEWIDGNLHLSLVPLVADSSRSTTFRVVGAEPRIWDLHGVENARMESRMSGLNVRVPMVKADVTLIRSSY